MTDRNPEETPGEFEWDESPEERAQFTQPGLPPDSLPEEPRFPDDEVTQHRGNVDAPEDRDAGHRKYQQQ